MKTIIYLSMFTLVGLLLMGIQAYSGSSPKEKNANTAPATSPDHLAQATFAGGCFWCTESDFEKVKGVVEVVSGYTGGHKEDPNYREVSAGTTGHTEAIQVTYDPQQVSYEELLDVFWRHIDPTDAGGQFVDRGSQYRSAIFYHNETQKQLAEKSKQALEKSGRFSKPIVTEIQKLERFFQ